MTYTTTYVPSRAVAIAPTPPSQFLFTENCCWPRAPCHARLCDRLNLRASPLTSHCAGGRRGASSAFAEPLTVQSLASAATLSTAPTRGPVGPWARGKLVGARERTSRRRPAPPAVSRLMQRDLHPRHPPWPHGWHVAPGPRQDVVGWERLLLFRRRARNAPDQVDQRRAGDGRDLAGQREAAPQRRLASCCWRIIGRRRPSRRTAQVAHHTTDASSVRGPRPWGPAQAFPRHGGRGRFGRGRRLPAGRRFAAQSVRFGEG